MRASFLLGTINPASSGGSTSGFTPQPGFVVSAIGPFAWDGTITITDSNNRFGPNGPIQLVFDDFRNGTPGATMGPSAPVSGIGSWIVDTRSPEISPYIFGPANSNAAGTGPCVRALNGEVSGAGGIFARGMEMVLGGEYTQLYSFRNERWNGWNGRNNNGGGGGYYKMEWFLDDGSFGSTAFDVITPVFIETTTQLQPGNIVGTPTWSAANGGEVTVTVNTGGNCFGGASSPPVIGSIFTAQIGNSVGGNYATFTPWVPAAYNGAFPGAVVIATGGSPGAFTATFTYPLATNPGPVTTKGTLSDYGAYGTGVPSLAVNTDIGGNSSGGHGLPAGGALNGKGPGTWTGAFNQDTWDQTGWNSIETYYLADQANPGTANGIRGGALFNAVNNQAYNHIVTPAAPLMGTPSPPWGSFNNWRSMGLLQDINAQGAPVTIDRSDHIVFLGNSVNSAAARFMLHDQPVLANSTMIMPLTDPSAWSAGSATLKLRQGRFPAAGPAGAYMSFFAATAPNTQVLVGQFTPAVQFDFFISTTGSDSNAGTTPATAWALTSLTAGTANNNKMAGKKIGLVAGTYATAGLPQPAGGFAFAILNLPAGVSASQPTYIASCDSSGNYAPRKAIILGPGGAISCGIIGNSQGDTNQFITVDGLVIDGNGTTVTTQGGGHLVQFYSLSYSRTSSNSATLQGIVVQNCELRNQNPQGTLAYQGGNYAHVFFAGCIGAICKNNLIHDMLYSGTDSAAVGHQAATCEIGCQATQYLNNTIYNCTGGIWIKEGNTGATAANNYIYNCATTALERGNINSAFMGWDGGVSNITGPAPTTQFIHHNVVEACGPTNVPGSFPFFVAIQAYNNTVYETATTGQRGIELDSTAPTQSAGYNNIVYSVNGAPGGSGTTFLGKMQIGSGQYSVCDYNCYFSATGTYTNWWQFINGGTETNFSTFATWKTAASGVDANGVNADPKFSFNGGSFVAGGGANQYQLAAGSPCLNAGRVGGVSGGAVINQGAWDGTVSQIGASFTTGN